MTHTNNEIPDIIKELFGSFRKTKEQMIKDYVQGKITKTELDEYMEKQKKNDLL